MNHAQVTQAFRAGKANAQKLVESFHVKYGHRISGPDSAPPSILLMALRQDLFMEEARELCAELNAPVPDLEKVAKEAADVLYVVYGLCVSLGIDAGRALELVHVSNMTKTSTRGPGDIKTSKGDTYSPPDMRTAVTASWWRAGRT